MSKKKISKNKHTKENTAPKKFWQNKQVKIIGYILLPVVIIAAAILIFNALKEEYLVNPNTENKTSENITGHSGQITDIVSISNVSVIDVAETSITVKWTTNVPATTELHATIPGNETTFSSYPDKTLMSEHEATINSLTPSTEYELKVISADASGKQAEFEIEKSYMTATPRTAIGIFIGDSGPNFSLLSTTGKNVSSTDFTGKSILICFWEITCNACKSELPYINDFYNSIVNKDIEVITISVRGDTNLIVGYLNGQKFTFPVLLDTYGKVANIFAIKSYPTSVFIDSNGYIAKIKEGAFENTGEISGFTN